MRKKLSMFLFIMVSCAMAMYGSGREISVNDIIKKVDELYRSKNSAGTIEMEIQTPYWKRTLRMNMWTQDMDKTFIRIISPKKEKGVATLRIKNEMWNFLPRAHKVIKIPPSMMMSSWMGSDFTNDDLVKESTMTDDYDFTRIYPDEAKDNEIYIKLIPKEGRPIVWGKRILTVRKKDYIPVREKYYDEKNNLMRILEFKDIKQFNNRALPSVLEMLPQTKKGHRTVITYIELAFDTEIQDSVFTLRNLRSYK